MQSETKQKKNRKLNIYFQNDVMTQKLRMKIPRKNWIKDANKGGGEEQSSFFVLYIL